jgi:hypothetical protein
MQYFLIRDNKKHGPYTIKHLLSGAKNGQIKQGDRILTNGKIFPLNSIPELQPYFSEKPPQNSPPYLLIGLISAGLLGSMILAGVIALLVLKPSSPRQIDKVVQQPFNVRGVKFGMTLPEVTRITKGIDISPLPDGPATTWLLAFNHSRHVDFTKDGLRGARGFAIGGLEGWHGDGEAFLRSIGYGGPPTDIDKILKAFQEDYGPPAVMNTTTRRLGGMDLEDYYAEWNFVDGTIIILHRFLNGAEGYALIASGEYAREVTGRQ